MQLARGALQWFYRAVPGRSVVADVKVISWNLWRLVGATVEDIAALIENERPDLLLMQEATDEIDILTILAGGCIHRALLPARIHGLAAWSPRPLAAPEMLALPVSTLPGRVPPRIAQVVQYNNVTFANVHLSHGQILNRRQLMHVATFLKGPCAMIGDFNAVGPTSLPGFQDVGPRAPTHVASNVLPFRLDRCLVRGLQCTAAKVLDRGPSDHCPIVLDLVSGVHSKAGQPGGKRSRHVIARQLYRIRDRRIRRVRPKITA